MIFGKRSVMMAAVLAGVSVIGGVSGCSSSDKAGSTPEKASAGSVAAAPAPAASAPMEQSGLVGPGCADYAQRVPTGAGSVSGMAKDPVAVAASNNPLLTTLVAAVSGKLNPQVNLVDTLDGGQFTVFAPVDSAFAKVPASAVDSLKSDSALLTKVLTYHVLPGRIEPDKIAGAHKTVEGADVMVTRSGSDIKVGGASVVCGGVQTANATVYLIDSVLMPPA